MLHQAEEKQEHIKHSHKLHQLIKLHVYRISKGTVFDSGSAKSLLDRQDRKDVSTIQGQTHSYKKEMTTRKHAVLGIEVARKKPKMLSYIVYLNTRGSRGGRQWRI